MFICDPCRRASGLFERLAKSEGPCEVCNTYDICDDWPSFQIPEGTVLLSGRLPGGDQ